MVAAPDGYEDEIEAAGHHHAAELPIAVGGGGATRAESVGLALAHVRSDLVAVHDAARPLIDAGLIERLVQRLESRPDADGVIAAAPLTDTIKRAREPRPARGEFPRGGPTVARTESRDHLWAAQTPQVFRTEALRNAHAGDRQRVAAATDDAMLVERAGGKVLIEPAPVENLKVTTPADLRFAETLLRN